MNRQVEKILISLLLAILFVLPLLLTACGGRNADDGSADDAFLRADNPLTSPSGQFRAVMKENSLYGVAGYTADIISMETGEVVHTISTHFRAHDVNLILWADERDELWAYSGDIGTIIAVCGDGTVYEITYREHDGTPPAALQQVRPRLFEHSD